jgi:uncharacterized membrane protein
MEERNKGLIVFGIILLIIGLVASFYSEQYISSSYPYQKLSYQPYQIIGILLDVAGIVFVALGLLYPTRKTPP